MRKCSFSWSTIFVFDPLIYRHMYLLSWYMHIKNAVGSNMLYLEHDNHLCVELCNFRHWWMSYWKPQLSTALQQCAGKLPLLM